MALLVVLLIHVGLIVALLTLAPPASFKKPDLPNSFTLSPIATPKPAFRPAAKKAAAKAKPRPAARAAAPTPPPKVSPSPSSVPFRTEMFDAVDIAALPNHKGDRAVESADTAADSGSSYGPGAGPGGQRLYNAEWYREPTSAELGFYLPHGASPGSWAEVACRTVEKFRVEDCHELGDSPLGSGLARGIVQAAWQFRVRPPRIGGQAQVGAWVRIRITWSDAGATPAP